MKTIDETMRDLNPMTMANLVMEDPNHQARARAKTERARKARQTQADRALRKEQAQRDMDRRAFSRKVTRMKLDHNATTAALTTAALFGGYLLALAALV